MYAQNRHANRQIKAYKQMNTAEHKQSGLNSAYYVTL